MIALIFLIVVVVLIVGFVYATLFGLFDRWM